MKSFAVLLLLGVGLPACALTVQDADDDGSSEVPNEAAQMIASAFCRWHYDCGCGPVPAHTDVQECEFHAATEITRRYKQGKDADLSFDDTCLADVAAYFDLAQCSDDEAIARDAALRGALDTMLACKPWSGGAREGQACTRLATAAGDDCAVGLACAPDFDVCVAATLSPDGAVCGGAAAPCQPGLTCVAAGDGAEQCLSLPRLGEACDALVCDAGTWCDPASSRCAALPSAGASCVDGGSVYEWGCDHGLVCEAGTCIVAPREGEPCADQTCAKGLACAQGVCTTLRPLVCDLERELP